MEIFNFKKIIFCFFLFLLGIYTSVLGLSYVVSAETGISFYEEDVHQLTNNNPDLYRIKNDISFSFSVNNGLLLFNQLLIDTSFNYTKRPDFEYIQNVLITEMVHTSFLLGVKYYFKPRDGKNNIAFGLYTGLLTSESISKFNNNGLLQLSERTEFQDIIFVPELSYFIRGNFATLYYAELRSVIFPLVENPYLYWQILLGVEVEINFSKKINLIKEKKVIKERSFNILDDSDTAEDISSTNTTETNITNSDVSENQ